MTRYKGVRIPLDKLPDFYPLAFPHHWLLQPDEYKWPRPVESPATVEVVPERQILRPTTKGFYRCGHCRVLGHTRKICPKLYGEDA